jgi:hypothetical protein
MTIIVMAVIRTGHPQNKSQKPYQVRQLAWLHEHILQDMYYYYYYYYYYYHHLRLCLFTFLQSYVFPQYLPVICL